MRRVQVPERNTRKAILLISLPDIRQTVAWLMPFWAIFLLSSMTMSSRYHQKSRTTKTRGNWKWGKSIAWKNRKGRKGRSASKTMLRRIFESSSVIWLSLWCLRFRSQCRREGYWASHGVQGSLFRHCWRVKESWSWRGQKASGGNCWIQKMHRRSSNRNSEKSSNVS